MLKRIIILIIFIFQSVIFLTGCESNINLKNKDISPKKTEIKSEKGAYLSAVVAKIRGDEETAAQYFKEALSYDSNDEVINLNAMLSFSIKGDFDEAAIYAEKIIAKNPDNPAALIILISSHIKHSRFEDAEKAIKKFNNKKYGSPIINLIQSWIYIGLDDPKKLEAQIKKLKNQKNVEAPYDFIIASLYDSIGQEEKAKTYFNKTQKNKQNYSVRELEIITSFYRKIGDFKKAEEILNASYSENPTSVILKDLISSQESSFSQSYSSKETLAKIGTSDVLFEYAARLNYEGAEDLVILMANLSLYLNPDFDLAKILLGEVYEAKEDWKNAIKSYQSVPLSSTCYTSAKIREALSYAELKKPKKALTILREILSKREDLNLLYIDIGNILRENKNYPEAVQAYNKVIEKIDLSNPDYWFLFYARGVSYERLGNWNLSKQDLKKSLELNPGDPLVLNYLGYSMIEKGESVKEALDMLKKAYLQKTNDGYIADSLGWAYYKIGNFNEAQKYMEEAAQIEPNNSVINDHLGDIYWCQDRKREGLFQWKRALSPGSILDEADTSVIKNKIKRKNFPLCPKKKAE